MAKKVIVNEKFTFNLRDFLYGFGISLFPVISPKLLEVLSNKSFSFDWNDLLASSLSVFIGYVGVKFFSKPSVKTTYDNNEHAKKIAKSITQSNEKKY